MVIKWIAIHNCLLLHFLIFFHQGKGFNLDEKIPIIKQGVENSLFGLSVEEHHTNKNPSTINDNVLLVGAPKASSGSFQNSKIVNPGGLFKCQISYDKNCERVRVDDAKPTFEVNSSYSWLGVIVKSQKPGGKVAVCAHRYTIHGGSHRGIWEAELGRCFILTNDLKEYSDLSSYEPCIGRVDALGSYSQAGFGYCQAGTSFDFAQNQLQDFVVGIPGMLQWAGGINTYQVTSEIFAETLFGNDKDQLNRINQNNSYVGFSVASFMRGGEPAFVAGAPRGNDSGQVLVFEKITYEDKRVFNITEVLNGEVLGSAFGYDLKIIDINGDNKDDLIVGAPQFYNKLKKQGGAVYIYLGNNESRFGPDPAVILYGELDSTFGISIASLGDINKDGFNDIAIGASGADNGVGQVYIYLGSLSSVETRPSQIIKPSNVPVMKSLKIKGFGYALSGGLDMDLNEYPDLAVGSLSDSAFIFRARPIVTVNGFIKSSVDKVNINATADFNPNAVTISGPDSQPQKVVSFNVSVCFEYTSLNSSFNQPLNLSYTIQLDVVRLEKDFKPRVTFVPFRYDKAVKIANILLPPQSENRLICIQEPVYLDSKMQDKLSPFVMSLSYDIIDQNISSVVTANSFPSMENFPITNKDATNTAFTEVNISKNCGKDEKCTSNLKLNAEYLVLLNGKTNWETLKTEENTGVPLLFVGAEKEIGLSINITNFSPGEDAHQAQLKILFPDFLSFAGSTTKGASISCHKHQTNNSIEVCDIGNPFRSGSAISLIIKFESDERLYKVNNFVINLALSTSSDQKGLSFQPYPVLVKVEAELILESYTQTDQLRFEGEIIGESAVKQPTDAGSKFVYHYDVENSGSSDVGPVVININWPYAIKNGKWLFYLLQVGDSSNSNLQNKTNCEVPNDYLDPLDLNDFISRKKRDTTKDKKKSAKEPEGVSSSSLSSLNLICPESAKCVNITCNFGVIPRKKKVSLEIEGILWNSTFIEEYADKKLIKVTSESCIYVNRSNVLYAQSSVLNDVLLTTISSEIIVSTKQEVHWWIIALASLAGVVCLVFLVLLLWRCGFFNRRRNQGDYHKAQKHRQASKQADEVSEKLVY